MNGMSDSPTTSTLDQVKSLLVSTLGLENDEGLDATTPLLGGLPELDSMSVVELVVAIEETCGVRIEDDELTGEAFETLGSLAALVERKSADVGSS